MGHSHQNNCPECTRAIPSTASCLQEYVSGIPFCKCTSTIPKKEIGATPVCPVGCETHQGTILTGTKHWNEVDEQFDNCVLTTYLAASAELLLLTQTNHIKHTRLQLYCMYALHLGIPRLANQLLNPETCTIDSSTEIIWPRIGPSSAKQNAGGAGRLQQRQ